MNRTQNSIPINRPSRLLAKATGYYFELEDWRWVLDKNISINVGQAADYLAEPTRSGFLLALANYATNQSGAHTQNILMRMVHMLRTTGASSINDVMLINYRAALDKKHEWYMGTIRGFLRQWHRLGYPGISEDVIRLLKNWTIKGNIKGDAVKRLDPAEGPLTDIELQAFNEGVVQAFERNLISLPQLAMSLIVSNTGRRPVQVSHLRCIDVIRPKNLKGEPLYFLNIPRGKQGSGFRASFKAFSISEELWAIVFALVRRAVEDVERCLGFELAEVDRLQVPLFPDLAVASSIKSAMEFRQLQNSDKLNVAATEITDTLQLVVDLADIKSERTGDRLSINARRFRYTTGTRAAYEGFGKLVIAELLDHSDTQNADVYVKHDPRSRSRLDAAIGMQLAPYAQAFAGVLVDSERDAKRGNDPASRRRTEDGVATGTCGDYAFCDAGIVVPCYTCVHFQPWLDAPHEDVYSELLSERERLQALTGDSQTPMVLDRTILAVADVIQRCERRRTELNMQGGELSG